MSLFAKATAPAYFKGGVMGFSGSGKSFTSGVIVRGLWRMLLQKELINPSTPVYFIESERGSQFEKARFDREKIELVVAPVRSFSDMINALHEVADVNGICILDSITFWWRELCDAYAEKKGRKNGLRFDDWNYLKGPFGWGRFTDIFVNSPAHLMMAGRAGFEYSQYTDEESGKKEIEKVGVKMRSENETAYEPDLLLYMSKEQETGQDGKIRVRHLCTVFKDRGNDLEHQTFSDPTFETFKVHFDRLNLGGPHTALRTVTRSQDSIPADKRAQAKRMEEKCTVVLDEIKAVLVKHFPSRGDVDSRAKAEALEKHFATRSWEKIKTFDLGQLENGRNELWQALEGVPYTFGPRPEGDIPLAAQPEQTAAEAVDELLAAHEARSAPEELPDDRRKVERTAAAPAASNASAEQGNGAKSGPAAKPEKSQPEQSKQVTEHDPAVAAQLKVRFESVKSLNELKTAHDVLLEVIKSGKVTVKEWEALGKLHGEIKKKLESAAKKEVAANAPVPETAEAESTPEEEARAMISMVEHKINAARDLSSLKEAAPILEAAESAKVLPEADLKRLRGLYNARQEEFNKKAKAVLF
jgi:hypothetical protein